MNQAIHALFVSALIRQAKKSWTIVAMIPCVNAHKYPYIVQKKGVTHSHCWIRSENWEMS